MNLLSSEDSSDDEPIINYIVHLGRERKIPRIQMRVDHFHYWDDKEFFQRFRLSKSTVTIILHEIEDTIRHPTQWNNALSPMEMLLITLRYLASGNFLITVGDLAGIHKSTAGRVIDKVVRAIAMLRPQYIKFPDTPEQCTRINRGFYEIARFPRVLGALDCTHIKIKSPGGENAETFRNRKGFFSFNVQCICDFQLNILDIVARWPGSSHDSTIFSNSRICARFENQAMGNGVLLGDSGYPIKTYLLTPFANTNTREENLYNEAQIRTRNTVERAFGVWKRRFPILSNGINCNLDKVQWIIVATAVLHNIAIANNDLEPPALTEEEELAFQAASNVAVAPANINYNIVNNATRLEMKNYFLNML